MMKLEEPYIYIYRWEIPYVMKGKTVHSSGQRVFVKFLFYIQINSFEIITNKVSILLQM